MKNWNITEKYIHFPVFHDAIDDEAWFIIGIHKGRVGPGYDSKIEVVEPPAKWTNMQDHLLQEYHLEKYAMMECSPLSDEICKNNNYFLFPTKTNQQLSRIHIPRLK